MTERGDWRTLQSAALGKFHAARIKTSWGSRYQRTVALVDGKDVVGSVEQYNLTGVLDGRVVRVCGIGSVHSEAAGRGYARRLVDMLLSSAARDGADMALLFPQTGIDDDVGEQFDTIHLTDLTLKVAQSPRHGAPMTMVRAGEERDLAAMVAMGRARATPFRFHLDRDIDFIKYRDHDQTTARGSRLGECAPAAFLHRRRRHDRRSVCDPHCRRTGLDARGMRRPRRVWRPRRSAAAGADRARTSGAVSDDPCLAAAALPASPGHDRVHGAFHRNDRRTPAWRTCNGGAAVR